MMDGLIPMNQRQAQKSLFPPGSWVYVYNNHHSPPQMMCSGEVTQVHLNIENMNVGRTELFFTVKSGETNITESDIIIVRASQLRFRNGCPVKVQSVEDQSLWIPAVVLGIQDVPANTNGKNKDEQPPRRICQYRYFAQLLHEDDNVDDDELMPEIVHDVSPERVRYRSLTEGDEEQLVEIKTEEEEEEAENDQLSELISVGIEITPAVKEEEETKSEDEGEDDSSVEVISVHSNPPPTVVSDREHAADFEKADKENVQNSNEGEKKRKMIPQHEQEEGELSEDLHLSQRRRLRNENECVGSSSGSGLDSGSKSSPDGSETLHWRYIRPDPLEASIKKLNGLTYRWCEKYNGGKGMWTSNGLLEPAPHQQLSISTGEASTENAGPDWRYIRPGQSEEMVKVVNGVRYQWCDKYNGGKGMWSSNGLLNVPTISTRRANLDHSTCVLSPSNKSIKSPKTSTKPNESAILPTSTLAQLRCTCTMKIVVPGVYAAKDLMRVLKFERQKNFLQLRNNLKISHRTYIWVGSTHRESSILVQDVDEAIAKDAAHKIFAFLRTELKSDLKEARIKKGDPLVDVPSLKVHVSNNKYKKSMFGLFACMGVKHNILLANVQVMPPKSPFSSHGGEMCLSYHIKGYCFSGCKRADDHREHTDAHDKILLDWCREYYTFRHGSACNVSK